MSPTGRGNCASASRIELSVRWLTWYKAYGGTEANSESPYKSVHPSPMTWHTCSPMVEGGHVSSVHAPPLSRAAVVPLGSNMRIGFVSAYPYEPRLAGWTADPVAGSRDRNR